MVHSPTKLPSDAPPHAEVTRNLLARARAEFLRLERLPAVPVALFGVGAVGGELARALCRTGFRRFLLADPKPYGEQSVGTQCALDEVGKFKVDVLAEWLRQRGCQVHAYPRELEELPEGVVTPETIVVMSLDNRHGDIGGNRRAGRTGARVVKLNVDPRPSVVAARAYDFRRRRGRLPLCIECQFTDRDYVEQMRFLSCDGAARGRRTNSPNWLATAAGEVGAAAVLGLLAGGDATRQWVGRERQWSLATGTASDSELVPRPGCRWDHRPRWQPLVRCTDGPQTLTLDDLLVASGFDGKPIQVRSCHPISLCDRCRDCGRESHRPRWLRSLTRGASTCEQCGGPSGAMPFWAACELAWSDFDAVRGRPLADWGVEPFSIFQFQSGRRTAAAVVGDERSSPEWP